MMNRIYLSKEKVNNRKLCSLKKPIFNIENNQKEILSYNSLQNEVTEIYDQGDIGSCTSNAFCGAYKIIEKNKTFEPSRLYVYYHERLLEDNNNPKKITDSGADVTDAIAWCGKFGICPESLWPYNTKNVNQQPPKQCEIAAQTHKTDIKSYQIQLDGKQIDNIKVAISNNLPVLLAIEVYDSFENTDSSGVVPMPDTDNEQDLGGHEILIIGYSDVQHNDIPENSVIVLNSWGDSWGDKGYCYIPYDYILNSDLTSQLEVMTF